jgi:hypothetical protein
MFFAQKWRAVLLRAPVTTTTKDAAIGFRFEAEQRFTNSWMEIMNLPPKSKRKGGQAVRLLADRDVRSTQQARQYPNPRSLSVDTQH